MKTGKQRRAAARKALAHHRAQEHQRRLDMLASMDWMQREQLSFLNCYDVWEPTTGRLRRESLEHLSPQRLAEAFRRCGLES